MDASQVTGGAKVRQQPRWALRGPTERGLVYHRGGKTEDPALVVNYHVCTSPVYEIPPEQEAGSSETPPEGRQQHQGGGGRSRLNVKIIK